MMNTARKREETLKKNIDISRRMSMEPDEDGRKWVYVNLKDYEFQIRQEELEKYMALRKKERDRNRWYREAQSDLFKATLIPRFIGIMMILMSIFSFAILSKLGETDGTWLLLTIPLGILLLIMPGCNKPHK